MQFCSECTTVIDLTSNLSRHEEASYPSALHSHHVELSMQTGCAHFEPSKHATGSRCAGHHNVEQSCPLRKRRLSTNCIRNHFIMGNPWSSQVDDDDNWKSDAKYAMEAGTFCVICGSPFDIDGDVYNVDPKEARYQVWIFDAILSVIQADSILQWLRNFRLLAHCDDLNVHRITSGNSE